MSTARRTCASSASERSDAPCFADAIIREDLAVTRLPASGVPDHSIARAQAVHGSDHAPTPTCEYAATRNSGGARARRRGGGGRDCLVVKSVHSGLWRVAFSIARLVGVRVPPRRAARRARRGEQPLDRRDADGLACREREKEREREREREREATHAAARQEWASSLSPSSADGLACRDDSASNEVGVLVTTRKQ